MKRKFLKFITMLSLAICLMSTVVASAKSTKTYWTTEHPNWFQYKGYMQVVGSYKIPKNPGYGLKEGKYVKQGYINYSIDGKSICGGRKYTPKASSKSDYNVYYVSVTCSDSLNPWAPETAFNYGWTYFN